MGEDTQKEGAVLPGPVVYPTLQDLSNIPEYTTVNFEEWKKMGLVKLVPPADAPRPDFERQLSLLGGRIPPARSVNETSPGTQQVWTPVKIDEKVVGAQLYSKPLKQQAIRPIKFFAQEPVTQPEPWYPTRRRLTADHQSEFAKSAATDTLYGSPSQTSAEAFNDSVVLKEEAHFWETLAGPPIRRVYNDARDCSFYSKNPEIRPIPDLNNINDQMNWLLKERSVVAPGINTTYAYIGARHTAFSIHKEDLDLLSCNMHHFGAPKIWYSVHEDDVERFETSIGDIYHNEFVKCPIFLRHKNILMDPRYLAQKGLRIYRHIQKAGEIILTFPHGYHWGINTGFAFNEAVNYVVPQWEEYGRMAKMCSCTGEHANSWKILAVAFEQHFDIALPNIMDT